MKIVKKDKKLAEKEKKEQERYQKEHSKRIKFFEGLKDNYSFNKYVIEEIIDFEIKEAEKSTFNNIEALVKATPEEVKNIAISKSANVLLLKKIRRMLNGD